MNELFRRSLLSVERGSKDNVATDRLGALLHFGGCVKIANRTRPIAHFATQLFKSLNASHDYTLLDVCTTNYILERFAKCPLVNDNCEAEAKGRSGIVISRDNIALGFLCQNILADHFQCFNCL